MILISHRGNINGKMVEKENQPDYIYDALMYEYDVEIDVWFINNKFILGHDIPQYEINKEFFDNKMWCHAKNIDALNELLNLNMNCFFHNIDNCTLTSRGYIWTYPGQCLTNNSIAVLPESVKYGESDLRMCRGICSDIIEKFEDFT